VSIDNPSKNDNRQYDFTQHPVDDRKEFRIIASLIPPGSTVVDLGCGNGTLLQRLQQERNAAVKGIELIESGVRACRSKGLDVIQGRIDNPLPFDDNRFDYAICNVTIQMVMYPEILLSEMKRIARFQIISFPNFAFYRNRLDFLRRGAMPKHMLFNYQWYSTGHIHQLSLLDFRSLAHDVGGFIERRVTSVPVRNPIKQYLINAFPNLFMILPIVLLEKEDFSR
jgi:methionine biosynthesis protein MetW